MNALRLAAPAFLLITASPGSATTIYIQHIADGGGWQTTLVVTSTTNSAVRSSVTCFQETTNVSTFFVGTFVKGTLSGQTPTLNATSGGMYGPNNLKFVGQKLVLTVEDFTLMGSPVTGTTTLLLSSPINGPPIALDSNISGASTFVR